MVIRQIEPEEILLPYLAAAIGTRHCGESRGAFQTCRDVTELSECLEVAPRPAAEIEQRERPDARPTTLPAYPVPSKNSTLG